MEISDEGSVREWAPYTNLFNIIPPKIQNGLFSNDLCLTCLDAVDEYFALGTNIGLVYWYSRKKGNLQRLRCEATQSAITFVKIANTVDYMVAAGNATGQVTVFQVPKEHPESVPDNLKPKTEQKVERYTISDLHRGKVTSIEWSKNGMRLFSGDNNGIIIMTEIDFYMHLCKSVEIVNETYEIVQISYHQGSLLVSSVYRTILCEKKDNKWDITQVGKKERKSLSRLGAVWQWSWSRPGVVAALCARPGLRLWRASSTGQVDQTLLFKEAISNPSAIVELLNPSHHKHSHSSKDYQLGPLQVFREHYIVTHNEDVLYILDPRSLTAVAVVDDLRRVMSVAVNKNEIIILEGPRSILRLGYAPENEAGSSSSGEFLMTKSLTNSLQSAANNIQGPVPFISSVLEQANRRLFHRQDSTRPSNELHLAQAEECFETLPPIKPIPSDVDLHILTSILDDYKESHCGTKNLDDLCKTKSEEIKRKLELYNTIADREQYGQVLHHSTRNRKKDLPEMNGLTDTVDATDASENEQNCDKNSTGVAQKINISKSCVMTMSQGWLLDSRNTEYIKKEIEDKEKILAKMLDLDVLNPVEYSIPLSPNKHHPLKQGVYRHLAATPNQQIIKAPNSNETFSNKVPTVDTAPKFVKIPNTWNLDNISLQIHNQKSIVNVNSAQRIKHEPKSPDEILGSDWEIV